MFELQTTASAPCGGSRLKRSPKKRGLQAMDAGGKDGTIRDVMQGFNPQGCRVVSFKAPNSVEAKHDFLWRIHRVVPAGGEIVIFNRSHYGDILSVSVYNLLPEERWSKRYKHINNFSRESVRIFGAMSQTSCK